MSLKGDKYETTEEVTARLSSSIVLYDREPVYISKISMPEAADPDRVARVWYIPLPLTGGNNAEVRKFLSSKKFDLTPFKMGYMNHKNQAVFVSRTPLRQYKQGLNQAVTLLTSVKGGRCEVGFTDLLRSQGFVDMVNSKYPSFKEAGEMLGDKKDCQSIAISRMFAFVIDHDLECLYLLHKGTKCGLVLKNDKALKVPPKFHFLREEMEDCRIPLM